MRLAYERVFAHRNRHVRYQGEDTFYVGTFKGIGRVYQQTFVDTYSKVVHAKLVSHENTDYSS